MPWDFALILLLLAVIVPWRGALRVRELLRRPSLAPRERLSIYLSTISFQWLAAAVVFWRCRARGLTLAGLAVALPRLELSTLVGLGLSAGLAGAQLYSLRRVARYPPEQQGFVGEMARKLMPQNRPEWLLFLPLVVTVALCEELVYRGFAFAVIENACRSLFLAACASSLLFAAAHLYQGSRGMAATFVVGLLFACARILTRSLAPSIAAHFVADFCAGLAASRLRPARAPIISKRE